MRGGKIQSACHNSLHRVAIQQEVIIITTEAEFLSFQNNSDFKLSQIATISQYASLTFCENLSTDLFYYFFFFFHLRVDALTGRNFGE